MKKLVFTLYVFLFLALPIFAQDQIILTNGESIQAKVVEILPQEIKYKKFDFQEGPTITLEKMRVFAIYYSNGTKDLITTVENQVAPAEPSPVLQTSREDEGEPINPPVYTSTNSSNTTSPAQVSRKKPSISNEYTKDDYLLLGGLSIPIGYDFNMGGFLGIERAAYFQPNLGLTSHISASYHSGEFFGSRYYDSGKGGELNFNFLLGLQARTRTEGVQGYFMAMGGSTYTTYTGDFSSEGSLWLWAIGAGAGVVINDQIDLGLRFIHTPSDFGGFSNLQIGAGVHF